MIHTNYTASVTYCRGSDFFLRLDIERSSPRAFKFHESPKHDVLAVSLTKQSPRKHTLYEALSFFKFSVGKLFYKLLHPI